MTTFLTNPRGLRNNNPGNIRHGSPWKGLSKEQTDKSFCQFDAIEYGIRAIYKILDTYNKKYGIRSVKEIIHRWAPPVENDTKRYILFVLEHMQKQSHVAKMWLNEYGQETDVFARNLQAEIVSAIVYFENGENPFNIEFIRKCKEV